MYTILIETADGSDLAFDCARDDTLLRSGVRAGVAFPRECEVGGCGDCSFQLMEGEIATTRIGLKLGCSSYPLSDCRIRLTPAMPTRR